MLKRPQIVKLFVLLIISLFSRLITIKRLMGHKDISVTLNTYTSVFDKFKEREIDKVNEYYLEENLLTTNKPKFIDNSNHGKQ